MTSRDIRTLYQDRYAGEKLVKIIGEAPVVKNIAGRHGVEVGGFGVHSSGKRVVICATIDNLLKGAATQCLRKFYRVNPPNAIANLLNREHEPCSRLRRVRGYSSRINPRRLRLDILFSFLSASLRESFHPIPSNAKLKLVTSSRRFCFPLFSSYCRCIKTDRQLSSLFL